MTGLLETFFETSDASNRRGELDGAAWRFVLPGAVDTVEWRAADESDARDIQALERHATVLRSRGETASGPGARSVGLVVGPAAGDDAASAIGIDLRDGDADNRLELRYVDDELRGIAPESDPVAKAVLAGHVGADGPIPRGWKQRVKREPRRTRRTTFGSLRGVRPGPPAWLVERAAEAGLDVSDFGWALWCRGEFGSQKLIMFLIAPCDAEPSVAVKITRDPRYNDRLENESDMLTKLAQLSPEAGGGAPTLHFHTTAWGSAVSAQSAVLGSDLRAHLAHRPELVGRVATWMSEMALATRTPIVGDELHRCLGDLIDWYVKVYPVPGETESFLRVQAERLAGLELHAVMQHGDPGPWNAIVTPDDAVAFLDWEAGEARGLPLWDLFYFLRSASLLLSPRPPWQSRSIRTRRDMIVGSEIGDLVAAHVRSYVDAIGLDPEAVEPLFHLCWVQRAIKEARRLPDDQRSRGTFHRFVVDGVEGRDQPGLRRITMRYERGVTP